MNDKPEAVACPMCGAQPSVQINQTAGYRVAYVRCQCGVRGPEYVRPSPDDGCIADAIAAWNTRATPQPDASALVEKLVKALAGLLVMTDFEQSEPWIVEAHAALDTARAALTAWEAQHG